MAEHAVQVARDLGAEYIFHTAGYLQNTASRFNYAIHALAPDLKVGNPAIRCRRTREQKLARLAENGLRFPGGIYSVDENLWARVIECGELDDPGVPIPEHVFTRTVSPKDAPREGRSLGLTFDRGLPVALDGRPCTLRRLIEELDRLAGAFGIGRFNGLERTVLGPLNHEVREAPAAEVIGVAHRALRTAILSGDELEAMHWTSRKWANLALHGFWHTDLRRGLGQLCRLVNASVCGEVRVELLPGTAFVTAIDAPNSPSFWNGGTALEGLCREFSYPQLFAIAAFTHRLATPSNLKAL
jgi:argininosuccinate synthase